MKRAFGFVALIAPAFVFGVSVFGMPLSGLAAAMPPDIPPPPPLVDAGSSGPALIAWQAARITCSDGDLPAAAVAPLPQSGWSEMRLVETQYRFSVDGTGRPLDIRRPEAASFVQFTDDLAPALAASRFAQGAPRHDCRVTFKAVVTPLADVSPRDAMALAMTGAAPRKAVWDRFLPAGTTCTDPGPAPLLRAFPDFARIPSLPGQRSWSMVGFDISASGKPLAPHLIGASGNAALDSAARDAVARSRFVKKARTGCLYYYWRDAATLTAPVMPDPADMRPKDANCPEQLHWLGQPNLQYPANYRRRAVEGWAVVAFDTAPWGETGNFSVLAAQPSADFGQAAINTLRPARLAGSNTGHVGCVERVRFEMAKSSDEMDQAD